METHPTSYPMTVYPVVKLPRREAEHSPPSSPEVKNPWIYTFTFPIRLRGVGLN